MFLWKIPDHYPEQLIGTYDRTCSPDRLSLKQGRKLPQTDTTPTVRFRCSAIDLEDIDDLASNAMIPIASPRLQAALLDKCPGDLQLLNVRVVTNDGDVSGYRIVNATSVVSAIDHDASEYRMIPGTNAIMKFKKLVLQEGALGTHMLARDSEYPSHLIVSDFLGKHLLTLKLQQVGLYRPEDMTW